MQIDGLPVFTALDGVRDLEMQICDVDYALLRDFCQSLKNFNW